MALAALTVLFVAQVGYLPNAHAHNDYEHQRPLLDALDRGFASVEADVFLVDGELRVAHDRKDAKPGRTLEKLYLEPLAKRAADRNGWIYAPNQPLTLLIDIKADGEKVYARLEKSLAPLSRLLTRYERSGDQEIVEQGAITVILSGDRPIETLRKQTKRLAFIDGRQSDLTGNDSKALIPLISESFLTIFQYWGPGAMPPAKKAILTEFVRKAHANGQRVRFWATPESPRLWQDLRESGVDLIGTDRLDDLARFLNPRSL